MADIDQTDLTTLTVDLLSAYFTNNSVPSENLAGLIQSSRAALAAIDNPAPVEPEAPAHVPAVGVRKSLSSPDHIISMIDGKPYKTLKRHLTTRGLTPAEYRARFNLPATYPMVAPSYSEQRRAVAEKLGLGRSRRATPAPQAAASVTAPVAKAPVTAAPSDVPAPKATKPVKQGAVTVKGAPKAKSVALTNTSTSSNAGKVGASADLKAKAQTKAIAQKGKTKGAVGEAGPSANAPITAAQKALKRKLSIAQPRAAAGSGTAGSEKKAAEPASQDSNKS